MHALRQKRHELSEIVERTKHEGDPIRSGSLMITTIRGKRRYYYTATDPATGKLVRHYIPKNQKDFAAELAQRGYTDKVQEQAAFELKQVEEFLEQYDPKKIERLYTSAHPARKELIQPVYPPVDELIADWLLNTKGEQNPMEIKRPTTTKNGEIVRSKSEKIIADALFDNGIPYRYEPALELKEIRGLRSSVVYPDFGALNKRTGKLLYWEHLGAMGTEPYASDAVHKINRYIANGIYPGNSLILTYETEVQQLDIRVMEELIRRYLL